MNLQRQVLFWIGALIVLVLFVWLLGAILLPFVAGMVLAYFLNPLADVLEKRGVPRSAAAFLVIAGFILIFVILAIIFVPLLVEQLFAFVQQVPSYFSLLQERILTEENQEWLRRLLGVESLDVRKSIGNLVGQGAALAGTFLQGLLSGGALLISIFALIAVTPIVTFYLLSDWHHLVGKIDSWLPRRHRDDIRGIARDIDTTLAGFLRGQALVTLTLGTYYATALTLVGLNFGLLIGFMVGILSFIPYIGSTMGLLIAGGIAFAQFWPEWHWIAVVLGIFFSGQFFENYILQPKLVGDRVGLHPVWLIFALFAFGYLLGFVGLLLAVPLAAATGVLTRFGIKQYLASPLYTGRSSRKRDD